MLSSICEMKEWSKGHKEYGYKSCFEAKKQLFTDD